MQGVDIYIFIYNKWQKQTRTVGQRERKLKELVIIKVVQIIYVDTLWQFSLVKDVLLWFLLRGHPLRFIHFNSVNNLVVYSLLELILSD